MIFKKQLNLKKIRHGVFKLTHNKIVGDIDEIEDHHNKIDQLRSLDYDIDGIVNKVNDLSLQKG